MNAIFIISLALSALIFMFCGADKLALVMQDGALDALKLCLTLATVYSVWMGIFEILERSGLSQKLSRLVKRPVRFLFGETEDAEDVICLNVTASILGLSGVATPLGISACEMLDKKGNTYAQTMLFVLSATSLQILPISVIALRGAFGSANPSCILFPSILSTAVSTLVGIILVKIFVKK